LDSCLLDHYLEWVVETGLAVSDFHFAAYANQSREQCRSAIEGLHNERLEAFRQILRKNYSEAE